MDYAHDHIEPFFERLRACVLPGVPDDQVPAEWHAFRRQCIERERAGVERFGYDEHEYLYRDNAAAGHEEATDGTNYASFEVRRAAAHPKGEPDEALQLALMAAKAFYEGYTALAQLQRIMPPPD